MGTETPNTMLPSPSLPPSSPPPPDTYTTMSWVWWGSLALIAILNTIMFLRNMCRTSKKAEYERRAATNALADPFYGSDDLVGPFHGASLRCYERTMRLLAVPYVFETVWRCYWPADYPSRTTFFDTIFNSVLIERCLAALGESCFVLQFVVSLRWISLELAAHAPQWRCTLLLLRALVVSTFLADCISQPASVWGCVTGNQLGFFIEGLFWAYMFGVWCACACVLKLITCQAMPHTRTSCGSTAETLLTALTPIGLAVCAYQIVIYVPWCYELWQDDVRHGKTYPTIAAGAWDALTHRHPTRLWSFWDGQVVWQTLYFALGTQTSIWLMCAPRLETGRMRPALSAAALADPLN